MSHHYFQLLILMGIAIFLACSQKDCSISSLRDTCPRTCIRFDFRSKCYKCKTGCVTVNVTTCDPADPSTCGSDRMCVAAGATGVNTCVERIREGEKCSATSGDDGPNDGDDEAEVLKHFTQQFPGVSVRTDVLSKAEIACKEGLVCRRETIDGHVCRQETQTACNRERAQRSDVSCDKRGDFSPLQCTTTRSNGKMCRCVSMNGTTIQSTERSVQSTSDAPDCENRKCSYLSLRGVKFEAPSQTIFIDIQRCRKCLCAAGEPTHCVQLRDNACDRINLGNAHQNRSCSVNKRKIEDGESIHMNCKVCRCVDGHLRCLRGVCQDEEDDDAADEDNKKCYACIRETVSPVCGNDGRTYPSSCLATNCRGLSTDDIVPGRCSEKDVCLAHKCNDSDICTKRGGITCLSRFGCHNAERFRMCVNLDNLLCKSGDDASGGIAVCGSDGQSYSSHCELLQTSAGVRIKHKGRCNDDKCSGGEVCGTDGETYSNICELQMQSANARVDYRGECMETTPDTLERDRCQRVRNNKKCRDVSNCKTAVLPGDGCCPMCGGGLTVGFNREAFESYLELNPSVETVDDLLMRVILSGLISEEDLDHCDVKASLLNEGDLFIAFEALKKSEDYCMKLAGKIERLINNPSRAGNTSPGFNFTSMPQVFQFASIAQSSSLISSATDKTKGKNGGQVTANAFSKIGIFISVLIFTLFF